MQKNYDVFNNVDTWQVPLIPYTKSEFCPFIPEHLSKPILLQSSFWEKLPKRIGNRRKADKKIPIKKIIFNYFFCVAG